MSGSCHIIVASASPPPTLLHRIYIGVAVLLLFEFYPLLLSLLFCTWLPLPCWVIFSPIPAFASDYYKKETGEEEASERGGCGWEERAREHERRGREGCRGVREKGKWLCARVSGSSTPWQIQCWCHWSCLMWRRVYLFSPLETHTCTVWKFYQPYFFFFLLHFFFFFNNCGVQECFHVGTFPLRGGIIFPKIKATASLPHASSLGCLYFWVEY